MKSFDPIKERIERRVQDAYRDLDIFYAQHGDARSRKNLLKNVPINKDEVLVTEPLTEDIEATIEAPVEELLEEKPVELEPAKPEPVKPDPVKPDPVKPDPVKPDPKIPKKKAPKKVIKKPKPKKPVKGKKKGFFKKALNLLRGKKKCK